MLLNILSKMKNGIFSKTKITNKSLFENEENKDRDKLTRNQGV